MVIEKCPTFQFTIYLSDKELISQFEKLEPTLLSVIYLEQSFSDWDNVDYENSLFILNEADLPFFSDFCFRKGAFSIVRSLEFNRVKKKDNVLYLSELSEIKENILRILKFRKLNFLNIVTKISNENVALLVDHSDRFLKSDLNEATILKFFTLLKKFEMNGFDSTNRGDVTSEIEYFLKEHLDLIIFVENSDRIFERSNYIVLPSPIVDSGGLRFWLLKEEMNDFQASVLAVIYSYFEFFNPYPVPEEVDENVFESLPYPMVLISTQNEIVTCNNHFLLLNILPANFVNHQNGEVFEIRNQMFKVIKQSIQYGEDLLSFFIFLSDADGSWKEKSISSQELGIITSSIAHELNNPLAGILAAVTVLELEDGWNSDDLEILNEMNKTITRCKKLVETFLGFSKVNINENLLSYYDECLEQASELIRFRSVEMNLKLDFARDGSLKPIAKSLNQPIIIMFFYLLLSEILTQYHHLSLINNDEFKDHRLSFSYRENLNEFIFSFSLFDETFYNNIKNQILKSKLIKHLMGLSGQKLVFENQEIFIRNLTN